MIETDEYVEEWFEQLSQRQNPYREPILDPAAVNLVKQISKALSEGPEVFIASVETLEEYILLKNRNKQKILDELLTTVVIVWIVYKNIGTSATIEVQNMQRMLRSFTNSQTQYSIKEILEKEKDVWKTLNYSLPTTNKIDDLSIVVTKFLGSSDLVGVFHNLSIKLLELVIINWKNVFEELLVFYDGTDKFLDIFKNLLSSKYYFPCSIFICSIRNSDYKYVLNVDRALDDISRDTRIHQEHYRIFVSQIAKLLRH